MYALVYTADWYAFCVRYEAEALWRRLPGNVWVKAFLFTLWVVAFIEPLFFGELIAAAVTALVAVVCKHARRR